MKKIVVLTGIYPPQSGGPAKFASTFPEWEIIHYDLEVAVITYTNNESSQIIKPKYTRIEINRNSNILKRFLSVIREIAKLNGKETIFIANGMFLEILIASAVLNVKYIAKVPGDIVWERLKNSCQTNLSFEEFQSTKLNIKFTLLKWLFKKSLEKSSKIISPTIRLSRTIENWRIPNQKIVVIPNGVDANSFKPSSTRKVIDILVVNRLVMWKNVDSILRIAAKMNLNVTIAGDGPEMSNLVNLAKELDCKANFLGDISTDELIKLYQKARLYILNSDFELTAYSLIEAQLSGLFSIANKNTGSSEVIQDGITGILIEDTSEFELKMAIQKFINYYESQVNPYEISRISSEKFDNNKVFKQINNLAQNI